MNHYYEPPKPWWMNQLVGVVGPPVHDAVPGAAAASFDWTKTFTMSTLEPFPLPESPPSTPAAKVLDEVRDGLQRLNVSLTTDPIWLEAAEVLEELIAGSTAFEKALAKLQEVVKCKSKS